MSPQTVRIIIFVVLLAHGIGHTMGVLAALGLSTMESWSTHSWLLSDVFGENVNRAICGVLYAVSVVLFVIVSLSLMDWIVPHDSWRTLAVIAAAISLVTVIVYWQGLVALVPNKVGALAVNIAVLAGYFIADWPSEADIGF
jgi:hypothetical protein